MVLRKLPRPNPENGDCNEPIEHLSPLQQVKKFVIDGLRNNSPIKFYNELTLRSTVHSPDRVELYHDMFFYEISKFGRFIDKNNMILESDRRLIVSSFIDFIDETKHKEVNPRAGLFNEYNNTNIDWNGFKFLIFELIGYNNQRFIEEDYDKCFGDEKYSALVRIRRLIQFLDDPDGLY